MGKKKKKKRTVRAEFRKRHDSRTRKRDFTKEFESDRDKLDNLRQDERISGKGRLTRKRTIVGAKLDEESGGFHVELDIDDEKCVRGRVVSVHGLNSFVTAEDSRKYVCAIRGLLKSLSTELQHVVVAGDHVMIQPIDDETAVIVRVENRRNQISRTSRKRQQILVSNIDQLLIVASAAEPVFETEFG